MNLVEIIRKVGENGVCHKEEMKLFLSNFLTIRESEFIFNVKWIEIIT